MNQPLAILYYSNLMPGGQLANRLRDLGYRVKAINNVSALAATCQTEKPMVAVAEMVPDTLPAVAAVRQDPATRHIPVLGYAKAPDPAQQTQARDAGVTLLVDSGAVSEYLPALLDQVLQID